MSKKITKEEIIELASTRNHELQNSEMFESTYQNIKSKLDFKCNTCGAIFTTSLHSYKNAKKTGCTNCKKLTTQETHKGKILTEETKAKIGEKASQRVGSLKGKTGAAHPRYKGGSARDHHYSSNADYAWKNAVKKLYGRACVLTGVKNSIVVHHLNSWDIFENQRYDIMNGVVLAKHVHKEFHGMYGYGENTEEQFAEFCQLQYSVDWFALKSIFLKK